jgi:hypothetical protein
VLVPVRTCPPIDAALNGRLISRHVRAEVEMEEGRTSKRLQAMRGTITCVYSREEKEAVLAEMRVQDAYRNQLEQREWEEIMATEEEEELQPLQPAPATDADRGKLYLKIERAPKAARWCRVDWDDEPDPPDGFAIFLMNPKEYSLKSAYGHWRVFKNA